MKPTFLVCSLDPGVEDSLASPSFQAKPRFSKKYFVKVLQYHQCQKLNPGETDIGFSQAQERVSVLELVVF